MKPRFLSTKKTAWIAPAALGLGVALLAFSPARAWAAHEQKFGSPDDAINSLVYAAKVHDTNAIHAIFGPEGHQLVSPDAVEATEDYKMFVRRLLTKIQMTTNADSAITLQLGADGWAFPIPLVSKGGQWYFDTEAGRQEVLARRIGRDEMGAIDVCRAYVQAQREYAVLYPMDDGVSAFAQHLRSTVGTHDGLFWPRQSGEALSPLGPLIAQAHAEGYRHTATALNQASAPYHGYYFKILTRQGRHAPGGKYDYVINGRMIAGFALVAWPAEWGNTGVMTFIVNQEGKIYQKSLGSRTATIAGRMTAFDPNDTWALAE